MAEFELRFPEIRSLAIECDNWFKEYGGLNYVSMTFRVADGTPFVLRVGPASGKTPETLVMELKEEVARLRKAIIGPAESVESAIRHLESWATGYGQDVYGEWLWRLAQALRGVDDAD